MTIMRAVLFLFFVYSIRVGAYDDQTNRVLNPPTIGSDAQEPVSDADLTKEENIRGSDEEINYLQSEVTDATIPPHCTLTFDAAANVRNELFFIKGTRYWRVGDGNKLLDTRGFELSMFWTKFPNVSKVDAVFTSPKTQSIIFISGDQYWTYTEPQELDPRSPRSVCDFGICNGEEVKAAFVWGENEKIYLIGEKKYWRLDKNLKLDRFFPDSLDKIKGIPLHLDTTFEDFDGEIYFLQGRLAAKLNSRTIEVDLCKPTAVASRWFECDSLGLANVDSCMPSRDGADQTGRNNSQLLRLHDALVCFILAVITVLAT